MAGTRKYRVRRVTHEKRMAALQLEKGRGRAVNSRGNGGYGPGRRGVLVSFPVKEGEGRRNKRSDGVDIVGLVHGRIRRTAWDSSKGAGRASDAREAYRGVREML